MCCFSWEDREKTLNQHYDLAINLEDTLDVAQFLKTVRCGEIFGAYADSGNSLCYTENSRRWFDLSLISSYGKLKADKLKFQNRQTYQEMIFAGLGLHFAGEQYLLPEPIETGLSGDVAIAADSGHVWPMKKWAYYGRTKRGARRQGLDRQYPSGKAIVARAPGRRQKSPVPGWRRQSADAFCSRYQNTLRDPLHLHEPLGNLRLWRPRENSFTTS